MTEKIDLRQKTPWVTNPPEIVALIEKFNGVIGKAEAYADIPRGQISKIRSGKDKYSEFYKKKIIKAVEGHPMKTSDQTMLQKNYIPATCPPLLADLIRFAGSKAKAIKLLGTGDGTFYGVLGGTKNMPLAWITRAKAAMGQSVEGLPQEKPKQQEDDGGAAIPPFVPWDGKKGNLLIAAKGAAKGRTVKNVPQPLIDLCAKYSGVTQAAQSMGSSNGTLMKIVEEPKRFNEKWQQRAHAALHGAQPALLAGSTMGEDFDKYTMGLAIVLLKQAEDYDRVQDIADILKAHVVFKKRTKSGWIMIYKVGVVDAPKFKKLIKRDVDECVCP